MRLIWILLGLCCFSSQTIHSLPSGSPHGSNGEVRDWLPLDSPLRKLLQDPDAEAFINGGQDAPEGRFPYACSLKTLGARTHGCGGSLIAPEWVLTAAHCVDGDNSLGPTPIVYVGAHGIDDDSYAEVIQAVDVFVHESYTGNFEDGFDIALIKLKKPSTRQPATLAHTKQLIAVSQIVATVGWGRTTKFGPLPKVLQLADRLEYVSHKNCQRVWSYIKESMLCAYSTSQATCRGDSGGPLVIPDTKGGDSITAGSPDFDVLVGVVSFGPTGCGLSKDGTAKPGVFTRVSTFRGWIDEKMGKSPSKTASAPSSTPDVPQTPSQKQAQGKCQNGCNELDEDLFNAADSGDSTKVKDLLLKGADVSSTHEDLKFTPLHVAASGGHVDIVEMLIDAGSKIDAQNGKDRSALHFAAATGHLDVVKVLIKAGATVDLEADNGDTPLMAAAFDNRPEVAAFLLESGSNVDAQNGQGKTSLYLASGEGHLDVAKVLIKAGATVDLQKEDGDTPLVVAVYDGEVEVVSFLLESGADVNVADNRGETPLMAAVISGNLNLVELMLDSGAEKDAQDKKGKTAVYFASFYGSGESIVILMKAGADVDIEQDDGATAVDVICGCLDVGSGDLPCKKGNCGEGEKKRLKTILED